MNAKEKAKQLVDKFYINPYPKQDAKDCVDEMIKIVKDIDENLIKRNDTAFFRKKDPFHRNSNYSHSNKMEERNTPSHLYIKFLRKINCSRN